MPQSILLINPNSSSSVTECIKRSAVFEPIPKDAPTLTYFQAPPQGPPSIDDTITSVLSAAACWPLLTPLVGEHDAFLVACYSDHPLIYMLREVTKKPVLGILEASTLTALSNGGKFGVVTTGEGWVKPLTKAVLDVVGHERIDQFAGVVASGLGVLEFHPSGEEGSHDKESIARKRVGDSAKKLVEASQATVVVLGCAGMEGFDAAIEEGVGKSSGVKVIDGVKAGIELLRQKLQS